MSSKTNDDNDVDGTGTNREGAAPGRCPNVLQDRLSRNPTTACDTTRHNPCTHQNMPFARKRKWPVDMNQKAIQCHEQALLDKNNGKCEALGENNYQNFGTSWVCYRLMKMNS